jgi:ABC-type sugar transport system ATPase subunit
MVRVCAFVPGLKRFTEPTSGLDSEASYQVVCKLSELAKRYNKTVLMTVHQPSSRVYELFDKICLLSVGRVVYCGERSSAVGFFQLIGRPVPDFFNPPEHFLSEINIDFMKNRQIGQQTIDQWAERFTQLQKESDGNTVIDGENTEELRLDCHTEFHHSNSWLAQTAVLTERSFLNARRNVMFYWIRLLMFGKFLFLKPFSYPRFSLDGIDGWNNLVRPSSCAICSSRSFLDILLHRCLSKLHVSCWDSFVY